MNYNLNVKDKKKNFPEKDMQTITEEDKILNTAQKALTLKEKN